MASMPVLRNGKYFSNKKKQPNGTRDLRPLQLDQAIINEAGHDAGCSSDCTCSHQQDPLGWKNDFLSHPKKRVFTQLQRRPASTKAAGKSGTESIGERIFASIGKQDLPEALRGLKDRLVAIETFIWGNGQCQPTNTIARIFAFLLTPSEALTTKLVPHFPCIDSGVTFVLNSETGGRLWADKRPPQPVLLLWPHYLQVSWHATAAKPYICYMIRILNAKVWSIDMQKIALPLLASLEESCCNNCGTISLHVAYRCGKWKMAGKSNCKILPIPGLRATSRKKQATQGPWWARRKLHRLFRRRTSTWTVNVWVVCLSFQPWLFANGHRQKGYPSSQPSLSGFTWHLMEVGKVENSTTPSARLRALHYHPSAYHAIFVPCHLRSDDSC